MDFYLFSVYFRKIFGGWRFCTLRRCTCLVRRKKKEFLKSNDVRILLGVFGNEDVIFNDNLRNETNILCVVIGFLKSILFFKM